MKRLMARQSNENREKLVERTRDSIRSKLHLKRDKSTADDGQGGESTSVDDTLPQRAEIPTPDRSGETTAGQFVRFTLGDATHLLGFIREVPVKGDSKSPVQQRRLGGHLRLSTTISSPHLQRSMSCSLIVRLLDHLVRQLKVNENDKLRRLN